MGNSERQSDVSRSDQNPYPARLEAQAVEGFGEIAAEFFGLPEDQEQASDISEALDHLEALQTFAIQFQPDRLKADLEWIIGEFGLREGEMAKVFLLNDPYNINCVNSLNHGEYFIEDPIVQGRLKMPEPNVMEQVNDPRWGMTTNLILLTLEIEGKDIIIPVSSIQKVEPTKQEQK